MARSESSCSGSVKTDENLQGENLYSSMSKTVSGSIGDIEQLKPRLLWEALHQGLQSAAMVVWLSDGGVGFWRLYRECFAKCAVGILDFYHAAGHLWRAANAWWAKEPEIAQICFDVGDIIYVMVNIIKSCQN